MIHGLLNVKFVNAKGFSLKLSNPSSGCRNNMQKSNVIRTYVHIKLRPQF